MTTDRDLQTQLEGASGIREADVPALPASFRDHLKRTVDEPASIVAARQLADEARDRHLDPRSVTARPRRLTWRPVAAVAALGTLAAASAVLLLQPAEQQPGPRGDAPPTVLALAGYSTTPEQPDDMRAAQIGAACAAGVARAAVALDPDFDSDTASGVLTEVRGDYALDIFAGRQNLGLCLTQSRPAFEETVLSVDIKPGQTSAPDRGVTADATTTADLDAGTGPQPYQAAIGRVAPDIASVTVNLSNGEVVTATVSNGWWAAWWPTTTGITATVMAQDGIGGTFDAVLN